MEIKGKSVCLLQVGQEHLDFISALECNQEVWMYEEHVESDIEAAKAKYTAHMQSGEHFDFVIAIHTEKEWTPIGLVQLWSYVDYRGSWELGFGMLPQYQGNGYGYEATRLLLDFAFNQLNAHKVVGMCNSRNQRSYRLMERLNMSREGTFRQELNWNDGWHDQYFYGILDREWCGE